MIDENDFCVTWKMDWGATRDKTKHPNRYEEIFEPDEALAELLFNEKLFLNSFWYREDAPEDLRKRINVLVIANDIFAWGLADAEDLDLNELESLWRAWKKDSNWGIAAWLIQKRKYPPQSAVEREMKKTNIWDIDKLINDPEYFKEQTKAPIYEEE